MPVGDAALYPAREYDAGTSVWTYQIYRFVQGQDTEPEKVCANICYTRSYPTLESARAGLPEDVNPEDGFGYLFGDGKNLYGFNTLTGSMAKLTFDGGVMQHQEVCTVDIEALMIRESDYAYMMDMVSPVIMDGELYFIFTDWRAVRACPESGQHQPGGRFRPSPSAGNSYRPDDRLSGWYAAGIQARKLG